jgi:predicted nicotinamide N-methyase
MGQMVELELPDCGLRLLQPADAAELPDDSDVRWAPLVPYWSVLWRSGVALGRELAEWRLAGLRVVELGCGLGAPSLVASRAGAAVLATDASAEALALLARNADHNGVELETARVAWERPQALLARAPFDLVLAADVLYEADAAERLLALLPRLAPRVALADPGRAPAAGFLDEARGRWSVRTSVAGVVRIHVLERREMI